LAQQIFEEHLALSRQRGIDDMNLLDGSAFWLSEALAKQGHVERAERLAREGSARWLPSDDRMARATGLYVLGAVGDNSGQYAVVEPLLEEGVALLRELGADVILYRLLPTSVSVKLHLGRYERAREVGRDALERARQMEAPWFIALTLKHLAQVSVIRGTYQEAVQMLQESIALLQRARARGFPLEGLGVLAHIARRLGQPGKARDWAAQALRVGIECRSVHPLLMTLPAAALLLADQDQAEHATELYALAWRHPVVYNSRWYEDVAGRAPAG